MEDLYLHQKEAIQNLYNNRIELYKKAAKYIVDDNGSIDEVLIVF